MSKILEAEFFTRAETAYILGCSKYTVRNLEQKGILYSEMQGNKRIIDAESLYDYITSHEQVVAEFYLRRADLVLINRKVKKIRGGF